MSEIIVLQKTYHGFESCYDLLRDVSEIWEFPSDAAFKKVKGEFQGSLEVIIKFTPADGDVQTTGDEG